ncbi:hypothetical protein [Chitinophaga flava]|uniref:Uncharacterized protein n=1 Tax=Chitinophaga flava TaxID=2259036 RepID=A0A365XR74_9BACT|nr:hypothetical protein [Chitinophaga flava]RBL88531.1 hypothetical protein DF182_18300 [Chitinophaga flava]
MSKEIHDIAAAMASFASKYGPETIFQGIVQSVDDKEDTVAVELLDGYKIPDVRLKSVIKDGGKILLVPKTGSNVLLARIDGTDDYVVLTVHEVSRVLYKIGNTTMNVDDKGYLFKRENETLRKLFDDLLDAILQMRFTTQSGPTINLVNATTFQQIKNRVKNLLKDDE